MGDAVLLAHAFLRRFTQDQRKSAKVLTEDAVRMLECHHWPGNVRELLSAVRRAAIMGEGERVTPEDLGFSTVASKDDQANGTTAAGSGDLDLRAAREAAERSTVLLALARTNGNLAKAAELLGVSRPTLYDLMRRLAIQ